jgi:hypothetical protein
MQWLKMSNNMMLSWMIGMLGIYIMTKAMMILLAMKIKLKRAQAIFVSLISSYRVSK